MARTYKSSIKDLANNRLMSALRNLSVNRHTYNKDEKELGYSVEV